MGPDPYPGLPGVEKVGDDSYRVTVRLTGSRAEKHVRLTLRLLENGRKGFSPLLNRFLGGEDFRTRPVRISDSGRIRNELQTLCAQALEYPGGNRIRLHFERIPSTLVAQPEQTRLREILQWYLDNHPLWFHWLDLV